MQRCVLVELVIYVSLALLSLHLIAFLPRKLPLITNVLGYMFFSVVDINKLTILTFKLNLVKASEQIPHFLSLIIHRDISFSLILLAFANLYHTTTSKYVKLWASVCTFLLLFGASLLLRLLGVLKYVRWNNFYEAIMIAFLMAYILVVLKVLDIILMKERRSA